MSVSLLPESMGRPLNHSIDSLPFRSTQTVSPFRESVENNETVTSVVLEESDQSKKRLRITDPIRASPFRPDGTLGMNVVCKPVLGISL